MLVVGLIGGVASGKSLVARYFCECGAQLVDGDRAGHAVLDEPEVRAALRARYGPAVFGPDGRVVRPALARIVFGPPPAGPCELAFLEEVTHPRIEKVLQARLEELAASGTQVAVLDAAVMLKAGWDRFCDKMVFVAAPYETRLQRALARGWTPEEFAAREAAQEPIEEKRKAAALLIDNSGTPEQTRQQVLRLWQEFTAMPHAPP
ncbi:MAG: dephospho-CoA kinase [Pirellulales bacterium]|nr:dephospho-CoA kinase [Pirellulales bacterium]